MACSFQPTRPAWGATMTPREQHSFLQFQSTRPAWGATVAAAHDGQLEVVSIHAPRGARRRLRTVGASRASVSIHAPRVGRDRQTLWPQPQRCSFNPRAPRGARPLGLVFPVLSVAFQSTRPAWGATSFSVKATHSVRCFNPRAPRGARRS